MANKRGKIMEKNLLDRVSLTIDNYKMARQYLKNDGDILNHFASLIFSHYEMEIPVERVKDIRRYIKATTNRMSIFRGDILYLISLLIALIDKQYEEELIEDMYLYMEKLEENFVATPHLALSSYVLAKYGKDKDKDQLMYKVKELYYVFYNTG